MGKELIELALDCSKITFFFIYFIEYFTDHLKSMFVFDVLYEMEDGKIRPFSGS